MWSRSECGSAETVQRLPINLQLYLSWGGWGLRTDAAECDTHFYVLSTSGIFLDTVCGDNGTDYTVGDDLYNWYFIFSSDNYRSRRERGRPVELLNACSVLIESGRSPAGDRASGTLAIGRWIWYI